MDSIPSQPPHICIPTAVGKGQIYSLWQAVSWVIEDVSSITVRLLKQNLTFFVGLQKSLKLAPIIVLPIKDNNSRHMQKINVKFGD